MKSRNIKVEIKTHVELKFDLTLNNNKVKIIAHKEYLISLDAKIEFSKKTKNLNVPNMLQNI